MTRTEASDLLRMVKWIMVDMGMTLEAQIAEGAEIVLLRCSIEQAHAYADFVLPKGRRGRAWLVLLVPNKARAKAFTAAVLRAVDG